MTTSWLKWLAIGLVGVTSGITACTVTSDDGVDDGGSGGDIAGRSGGGGRAGSGNGGATFGGSAGRAGAGSGGTAAGSGGSSGAEDVPVACETEAQGPTSQTPFDTCDLTNIDLPSACRTCLSGSCCSELKNCYATDPPNLCGYGGPDNGTEYLCYIDCLVEIATMGGGAYDPEMDRPACEMMCRSTINGRQCSLPGGYTNELALCLHDSCENECIIDPSM